MPYFDGILMLFSAFAFLPSLKKCYSTIVNTLNPPYSYLVCLLKSLWNTL